MQVPRPPAAAPAGDGTRFDTITSRCMSFAFAEELSGDGRASPIFLANLEEVGWFR